MNPLELGQSAYASDSSAKRVKRGWTVARLAADECPPEPCVEVERL